MQNVNPCRIGAYLQYFESSAKISLSLCLHLVGLACSFPLADIVVHYYIETYQCAYVHTW
jgi:hypothetical protein